MLMNLTYTIRSKFQKGFLPAAAGQVQLKVLSIPGIYVYTTPEHQPTKKIPVNRKAISLAGIQIIVVSS